MMIRKDWKTEERENRKKQEWLAHTERSHDRHTHAHGLIHTHTHTHAYTRSCTCFCELAATVPVPLPYLVAPRLFFYLPAETLLSHDFSKESVNRSVLP
jgi:hypothetical protein